MCHPEFYLNMTGPHPEVLLVFEIFPLIKLEKLMKHLIEDMAVPTPIK